MQPHLMLDQIILMRWLPFSHENISPPSNKMLLLKPNEICLRNK
jgi:hypothetical protein